MIDDPSQAHAHVCTQCGEEWWCYFADCPAPRSFDCREETHGPDEGAALAEANAPKVDKLSRE